MPAVLQLTQVGNGRTHRTSAFSSLALSPLPRFCWNLAGTCLQAKAALSIPVYHSRVILIPRLFLCFLPPRGWQVLWESLGNFGYPSEDLRCNQCFLDFERHGKDPQWPVALTSWVWQSGLMGIFPACSSASLKSCPPPLGASGMGKALVCLVLASVL